MMKQHKIGEVFLDSENFNPPKRVKCVEDDCVRLGCLDCIYDKFICKFAICESDKRIDGTCVHFIETDEPLTEEP